MLKRILILTILLLIADSVQALNKPTLQYFHRLRIETWDNAGTIFASGSPVGYSRQRSSLGLKWLAPADMELGVKFTHEFRYYIFPKTPFNQDEVLVDNLYLKWHLPVATPISIQVGRFNMMLGEGFIVMDPSPLDGSRTAYFNAFRWDWTPDPTTTLTGFYTKMNMFDRGLPIINDQNKKLVEQPEEGVGLYLTKILGDINLQAYSLQMNSKETSALRHRETTTFGGRVEYHWNDGWFGVTEDAIQFGKQGDIDRTAFGGYLRVGKDFSKPVLGLNQAFLGAVYLSGDDSETDDNDESWRPLWGRWPKWSDSFIYALAPERGVATWSNFTSIYGHMTFKPTPDTKIRLALHRLGSFQQYPEHPSYGGSDLRGILLTGIIEYKVMPGLTGHFLWEKFTPGGYYFDAAKSYVWLRSELNWTFDLKL